MSSASSAPTNPMEQKLRGANSPLDSNTFPAGSPACTPEDTMQCPGTTWSVQLPPALRVVLPAASPLDPWPDPAYPIVLRTSGSRVEGAFQPDTTSNKRRDKERCYAKGPCTQKTLQRGEEWAHSVLERELRPGRSALQLLTWLQRPGSGSSRSCGHTASGQQREPRPRAWDAGTAMRSGASRARLCPAPAPGASQLCTRLSRAAEVAEVELPGR
ncbi:hypothetical protein NN561_003129 [Cricetulus griseus]